MPVSMSSRSGSTFGRVRSTCRSFATITRTSSRRYVKTLWPLAFGMSRRGRWCGLRTMRSVRSMACGTWANSDRCCSGDYPTGCLRRTIVDTSCISLPADQILAATVSPRPRGQGGNLAAGRYFLDREVDYGVTWGSIGIHRGIARRQAIDDVHALNHLAEDGVLTVEVGGVAERYEPLAAGAVGVV